MITFKPGHFLQKPSCRICKKDQVRQDIPQNLRQIPTQIQLVVLYCSQSAVLCQSSATKFLLRCCWHGQELVLMIQKELIEPPTELYVKIHYPFTCQTLEYQSASSQLQNVLALSNLHSSKCFYSINNLAGMRIQTTEINTTIEFLLQLQLFVPPRIISGIICQIDAMIGIKFILIN